MRTSNELAFGRLAFLGVVGALAAAGCLLTSDFDGVAGVRPATEAGPGDAGGDADTGALSPCTSGTHVVCTDFDHNGGTFPPPGWNSSIGDGGVVVLDDTTSVSPPRSLSARLEGASSPSAYITRQAFLASFKALTVSFDMRIVSCPPQGKSSTLVYVEPSTRVSYGLVFLSSGVQAIGASVNGTPTFFQLQKQVPEQTWSRVVLRIELKDTATSRLSVTVDGVTSVDTDAPGGPTKSSIQLNLGLVGGGAPTGCEVRFDNYVFDSE
ncbi:MAG: hypothetical protein JST00_21820 [Deltaproteobacteria bacterium]|nr:hypothetical protein [Deltaproteobacteria bacterium]